MKNLLIAAVALLALNTTAFAADLADYESTTIGFVLSQDNLKTELRAEIAKNAELSVKESIVRIDTIAAEQDTLESEFAFAINEQVKTSIRESLKACCV